MRTAILVSLHFFLHHVTHHVTSMNIESNEARFILTNGFALNNHVFGVVQSEEQFDCTRQCTHSSQCLSANYHPVGKTCQLSDKKTKDAKTSDFMQVNGWIYMEKMTYETNVCQNGGVCTPIYKSTVDRFKCKCRRGFKGQYCETEVIGYRTNKPALSCKEIYNQLKSSPSGLYYFKNDSNVYQAYCVMDEIEGCGGGGWSLVMKIDGNKTTFHYDSSYWADKRSYDPASAGWDALETKMPLYWLTPFTHLCLGMRVDHVTRWINISYSANSLYDVISGGNLTSISDVAVSQWRSLLPRSSMQTGFSRSGFNSKADGNRAPTDSRARIGLLGNNENDMDSPDSRLGFGTGGTGRDEDDTNSCGNEAVSVLNADNGRMSVKAFCYILIQ